MIQRPYASLQNLFLKSGDHYSLLDVSRSLALNEFKNVKLYQEWTSTLQNDSIYHCFETMMKHYRKEKNLYDGESMNEDELYFERSPCINSTKNHEVCKDYCQWFEKTMASLTKKEILSLMRY